MLTVCKQEKLFGQLLGRPENNSCADCGSKSPTCTAFSNQGASIDFGVFVCLNCSGAHRALGPSITRVRSTQLDTWQSAWSDLLVLGNQQCNKYWEEQLVSAKYSPSICRKPNSTSSLEDIKRFVQDKYIKKRYASAGVPDPVVVLKGKIARGEEATVEEAPVVKPQPALKEPKKEHAAPAQEQKVTVNSLIVFPDDDDPQFSPFQGGPEPVQQPAALKNNFDLIDFGQPHEPKQQKSPALNFDAIASHHYTQVGAAHSLQHHILQHHNQPTHNMYAHQAANMYGHYQPPMQAHYSMYNSYHPAHQQPYMYNSGIPSAGIYPQQTHPQHLSGFDLQF